MAQDSFNIILNMIDTNSQKDAAAEEENSSLYEKNVKKRKEDLEKLFKLEDAHEEEKAKIREQIENQLQKERLELEADAEKEKAKDQLARAKERVESAATLEEKKQAQADVKRIERLQKATSTMVNKITGTLSGLFDKIKNSGKEYADYVERLEVGLIGSTKNYDSVSSKLDKVFSMNVFFSMNDAIESTAKMVEKGIAYNVELRSALDVMSDKIAATFDAFDSTLLRLIKIQQADSTQARLGMESLLTYYLNENFQNTEYLHGLSDQVSSAIIEAMSAYSGENRTAMAAEFEYSIQKWLGSFSSAGVSDSTITALAQGLGYLGSGDVSSLASNSALQQLIALSISKSGSDRSYGDMLLNGIGSGDVSAIMTGFYNLVQEISSSDNLVALNQYAKIFNLTVSDITSVLNLNSDAVKTISQDMKSYGQMTKQVTSELRASKLMSRSSYSEMMENIQKNIYASIGLDMANNIFANIRYEVLDQVANIVDMFDMGVEVDPFGVGASVKIAAGDMVKGTVAMDTYLRAYAKNITALGSALSPNLGALGGETNNSIKLLGGQGTSQITSGVTRNQATYVGNTDTSAVYQTVSQSTNQASSEILTADIDEEKEKMDQTLKSMQEIGDNVAFIVQLLNVDGIRVRYYPNPGNKDYGEAEFDADKKQDYGSAIPTTGGY